MDERVLKEFGKHKGVVSISMFSMDTKYNCGIIQGGEDYWLWDEASAQI